MGLPSTSADANPPRAGATSFERAEEGNGVPSDAFL